jgi:protein TonB
MGSKPVSTWVWMLQKTAALAGAALCTLGIFLFLPVMQTISSPPPNDLLVRDLDVANLPPPPPPPPEQEIEEEQPPERAPELVEDAPPLDLTQLELALNPGFGDGSFGDFGVQLVNQLANGEADEELDRIFSLADLDQRPRVIFQRMPQYPPELRKQKRQGTVHIIFRVDTRGRVFDPKVEKVTDPAFAEPALEAVKQWKFEPGTRNGEKVPFKMRVPITFNAA